MSRDMWERCPETSQCAPGRIRTCDPLLRRQPLYPLSYRRSSFGHSTGENVSGQSGATGMSDQRETTVR